ncbi:MAG TPA: type VI secretion system ATPase TssH, partial [Bradyrhizobium sp.]|nr:type VI secretion system ATPase TssH [Bradyrhizobium sp.]
MADISLEAVTGKLNRVGYDAFIQALRQAKGAGNRNLELAHWLTHILQNNHSDITLTAEHFKLDRAKLLMDLGDAIGNLRQNQTEMPEVSEQVQEVLDSGWYYATLLFGETQIRTGHLLAGAFKKNELRRALTGLSREFGKINADTLTEEHRVIWRNSEEENLRPMDGSGLRGAGTPGAEDTSPRGTTALDRFSQDLTAKAASGEMDPILGRDE